MKILELNQNNKNNSIVLKAIAGEPEFRHLKGFTDQICMFAIQTINQPVKITKTGSRNSYAKWFLVPASLRSLFNTKEYNYDEVKAGFVEYKDCMFFIYKVDKKLFAATSGKENEKKKLGN